MEERQTTEKWRDRQGEIARAMVLFCATLALAHFQNWDAGDVAWSMWSASLVTGYIWILAGIFGGSFLFVSKVARGVRFDGKTEPVPVWGRALLVTLSLGGGLFMLGFFTIHFGGFHAVHSIFLDAFFPLDGSAGIMAGFPESSDKGPEFDLLNNGTRALSAYWPFVLFALLWRMPDLIRRLAEGSEIGFGAPYAAVVKNHLLIFLVAGMVAADLEGLVIYAVTFLYFFPFGVFFKGLTQPGGE